MSEHIITFFTAERFGDWTQIGLPVSQEWEGGLARWLTWPTFGETKRDAGAWCPCALADGRVKDGTGPMSLLVADVDDAGPGAIARTAEALAAYQGAIIPTFSATRENEKHRIVLVPDRPFTADEFPIAWSKMARKLAAGGIALDKGCKNLNRLYFSCVARSSEAWLGARVLDGKPLDVDALLTVARREDGERRRVEEAERTRRRALAPVGDEHRDKYIAAAIANERDKVASVGEGGRHDALLKAVFALARPELGLTETEIERALLETFVAAAGEHRRREGERAIRDATAARAKAGS